MIGNPKALRCTRVKIIQKFKLYLRILNFIFVRCYRFAIPYFLELQAVYQLIG